MLRFLEQQWRKYAWGMQYGKPRRTDFVEYYMRLWFTFCLRPAGVALLVAMLVPIPTAMLGLDKPSYQLCVAIFFLLFVAWLVSCWPRPRIRLSGGVPEKVNAGTPFRATYILENTGKRSIASVGVDFFFVPVQRPEEKAKRWWHIFFSRYAMGMYLPQKVKVLQEAEHVLFLKAGESIRVEMELIYVRRGVYDLPPLFVYTEVPFGLFRTSFRLTDDSSYVPGVTVTVLPRFSPAEGIDIPPAKKYQPGGIALTSNIGESPEYIGSREYRYGDNVRRIDFPAWARTGTPVIREYQEEYYSRIALVMDTYVPKNTLLSKRGYPNFEGTIQLSAAIADALSNGEYIIDLFAAGSDLYVFRAGRHTAHFENILEVLSCLDHCTENPFEEIAPALLTELSNISTAVFVLMDWDSTREAMVNMALQAGCSVKLYIVSEGTMTRPIQHAESLVGTVQVLTPGEVDRGEYSVL